MVINPKETPIDLPLGRVIELEFQTRSNEILDLTCRVIWAERTSPDNLISKLGLEIMEESQAYEEFFKALYIDATRII